jgi:hypothetical protein|nr:hypothetical protein [Leptospira ainlahdjerensis]
MPNKNLKLILLTSFFLFSFVTCRFISSLFLKDDPTPSGMIVVFQKGEVEIERSGKKNPVGSWDDSSGE